MQLDEELETLLQARFTLIYVNTTEETRAIELIRNMAGRTQRTLVVWDLADGFEPVAEGSKVQLAASGAKVTVTDGKICLPAAPSPIAVLEQIEKLDIDGIFVLKDFDDCWSNAQIKRKLRNVAQKLKRTRKSIIVIGCCNKLPEQLKDEAFITDFALPDLEDLQQVLDRIAQVQGVEVKLSSLGKDKLLKAALGLSSSQALRVFSRAVVSDGCLDDRHIEMVSEEKRQVIRESEALEFFPVSESVDDIGGLDLLKEWLRLRERALSEEARKYMLPEPKGIVLLGIPGTGKSLTAKTIGGIWRMPLLRLDVGALFGSLVGESEERTRKALQLAETVAPCVLWIDELDKAFSPGDIDGGVSRRVFGSVLTWMQEKKKPCFVVATANNVNVLPPELLRRGRFDEIFFLDLPTLKEREEIFSVHLRKRNRLTRDFALDQLAKASEGYVGAEIEQAVIDGMYLGFDARREFTTEDILQALKRQIPLSVSQGDAVDQLRKLLLDGKAQSASFRETSQAKDSFVELNLEFRPR